MPLSERVRIEVYLPDLPRVEYRDLLEALEEELSRAFGGTTVVPGLNGSYLSRIGNLVKDRVNVLYTDTGFKWPEDRVLVSRYTDRLREAVYTALAEETVLVAAYPVYHSE